LGNFFTIRDLLAKGFSGREIRYRLLAAHYRETFNFTLEDLSGSKAALSRIDDCLTRLKETATGAAPGATTGLPARLESVLDEDLNISGAWGVVFEWIGEMNRRLAANLLDPASAAGALADWARADSVLGIGAPAETEVPAEIITLMEGRQAARKARDFKQADAIRDELKAKGWVIEDTPKGPRAKRI
jgi:cysteinyl-tRNA synthetase